MSSSEGEASNSGFDQENGFTNSQDSNVSSRRSDSDEEKPEVKSESPSRSRTPSPGPSNGNKRSHSDDEEEEPSPKRKVKNGKVKVEYKEDSDFEDEVSGSGDDSGSEYGSSKKKTKKKKEKKKSSKKPAKKSSSKKRKAPLSDEDDDDEDDYKDKKKKKSKKDSSKASKKSSKSKSKNPPASPTKSPKKKKEEDEEHVWRWWEESDMESDYKWKTLEHKGPVFAPPYEPLPESVKFRYDGKKYALSEEAEEVATFYAKLLDHDYTTKDVFNKNFFHDWRKYFMTQKERDDIRDLKKCDFRAIHEYFKDLSEKRKSRTPEEKKKEKEAKDKIDAEFGVAIVDGHKQKIGNFRLEPPGLFRGRGEHPKMGKIKKRIQAKDIIINIGKEAFKAGKGPVPPAGQKWKEIRHDRTVTWLASWTENIMGNVKYIMLNPSSKLKSIKDWQKYEKARDLHELIDEIRKDYTRDWKDREMVKRQRAVALYFIDRLALRAGNEKDDSEAADTVGCCSLRFEHIKLLGDHEGKQYVVQFDFLGKDSIRYFNQVPVEKRVYKNLKIFLENKKPGDDLFDRLTTMTLNKYLNTLMDGLTAKVFRTYNASITLERELEKNMKDLDEDATEAEKVLAYNRANRSVAILCNHQRTVPKGFEESMEKLREKIKAKKKEIKEAKKAVKAASKGDKAKAEKTLKTKRDQLNRLEIQEKDRDENKQIALGTSKLNYLDPRITVAWCKKHGVELTRVYTKTHRDKFRWAIEMAGPEYMFDRNRDKSKKKEKSKGDKEKSPKKVKKEEPDSD